MVHNYYQQPGGEDIVYESEAALLESAGHEVQRLEFRNSNIGTNPNAIESARLAASTIWSREAHRQIKESIASFRPDVAHFHNTFPLVSPRGYEACRQAGIPVVQTLHNYRLICPSATLFRDGQVCEDCPGRRIAWPGVLHKCYRGSRTASATVAAMQATHRLFGTWKRSVDVYISLSESSRQRFLDAGFEGDAIRTKPNFLASDPGPGSHNGGFALFVGRLAPEKGIKTLLKAWWSTPDNIPLKVIGDGPLAVEVEAASQQHPAIQWLGRRTAPEALELMGQASVLVFPSEWPEPFGRTLIEAFSKGTPVIASKIGAAEEIVTAGAAGLQFEPGNAEDLARNVASLFEKPSLMATMGREARRLFECHYTAETNLQQITDIYDLAVDRFRREH